jgi:acyl-CoA synthetase (AMP-forming)/AMP-acid ligase II
MTTRELMLDIVARHQDKVFLVDANTHRELTFGEFHRQSLALAAELSARGLRKGDRIGVMVPNCCELAVLYFACIYLGVVLVPINPASSKSDVEFILTSCQPVLVLAGASSIELARQIHPKVLRLLTAEDSDSDKDKISDLGPPNTLKIDDLPDPKDFLALSHFDAEDLIVIMYTSGTSAKPKGFAHKRDRMFRNATAFAAAQNINEDSRFYLTLSMAYMGGFYNLLVLPFLCGASVVIDHVFDARSSLHFWEKARANNVNALWMAPTVLSIMLRMDRGRTGEEFCRESVRQIFVGFAPLALKVKNEFEERYGVRLIENYGLSETLFVTARSESIGGGHGYVGEPLPGLALRIVNDEGGPVTPGADGEIQILTPDLMAGYLDSNGHLLEVDNSGWFSTGDMGHLENGKSLSITGRKKDLIIRGGVNISPAAVEEALLQVGGITEVAVVSIPHELYGEDIVAVLKLDPGVELDSVLNAIIMYAKENLASHQQPARYITIDEFPRTANGKVQKSRIREMVAQKLQVGSCATQRKFTPSGAGVSR